MSLVKYPSSFYYEKNSFLFYYNILADFLQTFKKNFYNDMKNIYFTRKISNEFFLYIGTFLLFGIFVTSIHIYLYNRWIKKELDRKEEIKSVLEELSKLSITSTEGSDSFTQDIYNAYIKEYLLIHALETVKNVNLNEINNYIKTNFTNLNQAKKFIEDFKDYFNKKNISIDSREAIMKSTADSYAYFDNFDTLNDFDSLKTSKKAASKSDQYITPRRSPRLQKY